MKRSLPNTNGYCIQIHIALIANKYKKKNVFDCFVLGNKCYDCHRCCRMKNASAWVICMRCCFRRKKNKWFILTITHPNECRIVFLEKKLQFHANSKSSFPRRAHTNGRRKEKRKTALWQYFGEFKPVTYFMKHFLVIFNEILFFSLLCHAQFIHHIIFKLRLLAFVFI